MSITGETQHRSTTPGCDVTNQFSYLQWQDLYNSETPFQILIEIPSDAPEQRKTNLVFAPGPPEIVRDIRAENDVSLDKNGFALMEHQVSLDGQDWYDVQKVEGVYLPECEQLIRKRMDGVDRVHFYDWRLRDTDVQKRDGEVLDMNNPVSPLGPAMQVHVDQSPSTVVERIFLTFPDEAERLLQGRVRLINLWRPLNGPLKNWPLALCDGMTIPKGNLLETDRVRRKYTGRTMFVMHEPGMEWHYVSEQANDEVLVFKSFDSQDDVAGYCAHASFCMPGMEPDSFPRHSIELRALVFTNA